MRFFVKYDTYQDGPYDLVSMIRKIRNGDLRPDILVLEEADERAVPAGIHPKLESFFHELKSTHMAEGIDVYLRPGGTIYALKQGWMFFQHHSNSVLCSGTYLMAVIATGIALNSILPPLFAPLTLLLTWIVAQFFLGGFLLSIAQIHRGERLSFPPILRAYGKYGVALLAYGIIAGVLSAVGGLFFIIPGLMVLAYCIFAPLIIAESPVGTRYALRMSHLVIKRHGKPFFELMIALIALNFIAALFFVFPLLITLPITMSIIVDIYDRLHFNE